MLSPGSESMRGFCGGQADMVPTFTVEPHKSICKCKLACMLLNKNACGIKKGSRGG